MLVLFDVDGTLLLTRGAGVECMGEAMWRHFGRRVDLGRVSFPGGLDPIIFRDLCVAHGLEPSAQHHGAFRAIYARLLGELLAAEPGRAYSLPGVSELIDALRATEGLALGLLTGNYPETARLKIAAAGLDPEHFQVGAFGTDGQERHELCFVARDRHAARVGFELAMERVVLIGDTPRDVECALASGARILAVATGRYSVAELRAAGAELAVEDLRDTRRLVSWILDGAGERAARDPGLVVP